MFVIYKPRPVGMQMTRRKSLPFNRVIAIAGRSPIRNRSAVIKEMTLRGYKHIGDAESGASFRLADGDCAIVKRLT